MTKEENKVTKYFHEGKYYYNMEGVDSLLAKLKAEAKENKEEVERLKLEAKILLNGIGNGTLQIKEYQKDLDDAKIHIESYKAEAKEKDESMKDMCVNIINAKDGAEMHNYAKDYLNGLNQ